MSKIYFTCSCGNKMEIDLIGEGYIDCEKCNKVYIRKFNGEAYEILGVKNEN